MSDEISRGIVSVFYKTEIQHASIRYGTQERFNRQLRKVVKSKMIFHTDDSLLKMLYLATMGITKNCTGHRQDCGQIYSR